MRSPVEPCALESAFQALVDRHGALRTTFPAVQGEPRQRVADRLDYALAFEDATGWSEERLRSRLEEDAWRPFDLENGPLLRVTLFTGGPGGPVILLVIHHIVADFRSLAVLLRELPELYREAAGGVVERQGGLSLAPQYNTDLFDGTTAARLMERFSTLLRSVVRSPGLALPDLPMLPEAERWQLLAEWNDAGSPPPPEATLHALFEAQAWQTPDVIALIDGRSGERWTFRS